MSERLKSLLIYSAKCAAGCLLVYLMASVIHYDDISWTLISVLLVLSPDGKDSVTLALTRIKANVVGAGVGVTCLLIWPVNLWTMTFSLILTISICYAFKLDVGIRSALAATIILMLHHEGLHVWDIAIQRLIAVFAGCVLALGITYAFHFRNRAREAQSSADKQDG